MIKRDSPALCNETFIDKLNRIINFVKRRKHAANLTDIGSVVKM